MFSSKTFFLALVLVMAMPAYAYEFIPNVRSVKADRDDPNLLEMLPDVQCKRAVNRLLPQMIKGLRENNGWPIQSAINKLKFDWETRQFSITHVMKWHIMRFLMHYLHSIRKRRLILQRIN